MYIVHYTLSTDTLAHICAFIYNGSLCSARETVAAPPFYSSLFQLFISFCWEIHSRTTPKIRSAPTILFVGLIWISACGEFTHVSTACSSVVLLLPSPLPLSVSHVDSHINVIINGMLVYRLDVYFNSVWSLWLGNTRELSLLLLTLTNVLCVFPTSFHTRTAFFHSFPTFFSVGVCIHFSNSIHIFSTHSFFHTI